MFLVLIIDIVFRAHRDTATNGLLHERLASIEKSWRSSQSSCIWLVITCTIKVQRTLEFHLLISFEE